MTNSLYVRGNLSNPDHVLVDIGTGFFIEKVCENVRFCLSVIHSHRTQDVKSATQFYEDKVKELGGNIQDLETIVQNKSNSLRMVEEG